MLSRSTPAPATPRREDLEQATTQATAPGVAAANLKQSFIDYGSINFTLHNTTENAEFVLTTPVTELKDVARHMIDEWGLERPGILLRVTGSLQVDEIEEMEDVLEGIVHSASEANGFIFTGGLDFGIASLIGQIISRERHRCQAPLIGVSSWSAVQGRDQIFSRTSTFAKGGKRKYQDAQPDADMSTVSLQPVHTHFVLVDFSEGSQPASNLSTEAKLLAARTRAFNYAHDLEEALATLSHGGHTPRVLVVLNGDETVRTLREPRWIGRVCVAICTSKARLCFHRLSLSLFIAHPAFAFRLRLFADAQRDCRVHARGQRHRTPRGRYGRARRRPRAVCAHGGCAQCMGGSRGCV